MDLLIGRLIKNRYRVDSFIGRGGMADVFKVWDTQRASFLAMKLLHEDLAIDRVFLRRFVREAKTLAKLQHPNIVRFYGLEQDGPLAFILLDFIDGVSLKRKIFDARGPMPFSKILTIFSAVCGAIQFAHFKGLVHCDLKPSNIMIDTTGKVFVTDFGIARMTDAATATMVGAGTPAYMAPEQVRGKDPTPQTDVYALGIVLFEMLTAGERPFVGDHATITGSTREKVRWEQVHQRPPSLKKWNSDISVEVEDVVIKCLSKDPEDRFQNASDLFDELRGSLSPFVSTLNSSSNTIIDGELSQSNIDQPARIEGGNVSIFKNYSNKLQNLTQKVLSQYRSLAVAVAIGLVVLGLFTLLNGRQSTAPKVGEDDILPSQMGQIAAGTETAGFALSATLTPRPTIATSPSATFTLTPTETPGPKIEDIHFCDRLCDEAGAIRITSAPERATRIYIAWTYSGLKSGVEYTRIWTMDEEEWVHYECVWQGSESGNFNLKLYDDDGLRSGVWIMRLYVEGSQIAEGSILVEGNYNYWDVPGFLPCPDF